MDYFCYVSRSKVDQLFQNLSSEQVDQWIEKKITENNLNTSAKADWSIANIVKLFKGEITYGHKGIVQYEKKLKTHYVEKLRTVLLAIAREQAIPSLSKAIEESKFNSMYYHHEGKFKVEKALVKADGSSPIDSTAIVTVCTEVNSKQFLLDCSLRFFSEGNQVDGTFAVHSGNHRFFSGDIELWFETIFILLEQKEDKLIGTPLFLKLLSSQGDSSSVPIIL